MPTINTKEIVDWSVEELKESLEQNEMQLVKLKFDNASKGLEHPTVIRDTRRDIARLRTEMRRRELEEQSSKEGRMKIRKRRRSKK